MNNYITSYQLEEIQKEFSFKIDLKEQKLELHCLTDPDGEEFSCDVEFDNIAKYGLANAIRGAILQFHSDQEWYASVHSKMEKTMDRLGLV